MPPSVMKHSSTEMNSLKYVVCIKPTNWYVYIMHVPLLSIFQPFSTLQTRKKGFANSMDPN